MITKFKIFEGNKVDDVAQELVEKFSQDEIDEYYDENYSIDIEEVVEYCPHLVEQNIDDDEFVKDFIDDEISNRSYDEYDDYDFKDYIKDNITDDMEEKVIELYKNNNDIEENNTESKTSGKVSITKNKKDEFVVSVTSQDGKIKKYTISTDQKLLVSTGQYVEIGSTLAEGEETYYDDSMLDDLSKDELIEVIEVETDEDSFVEHMVKKMYDGEDAMSIIDSIYGKLSGKELYDIVRNYIDDDALMTDYKDNESDEYKEEYVKNEIYRERELQSKLLNKDSENVLLLAELFEEDSTNNYNISDEYDFQKLYIEQYIIRESDEETPTEKETLQLRAEAIFYLYKTFGLNSTIEDEYEADMWMISSDKYNL